MINAQDLTPATLATFTKYAKDAGNWSGNPWVSKGNIDCTKAMRGNLSDLVKKGLIALHESDGMYIQFTTEGKALAASLGIEIDDE